MSKKPILGATLLVTALLPGQRAMAQATPPLTPQSQLTSAPDAHPPDLIIQNPLDQYPLPPAFQPEMPIVQPPFSLEGLTLHFDRGELEKRIIEYEGIELYPYKDHKHIPTIGRGFNLEKIHFDPPDDRPYFNGRQPYHPSAEEIWAFTHIPENFKDVLESVRYPTEAQRLKISAESIKLLFKESVDEAVHNAAAHFRHFNEMTATQQMAAIYLEYNMGKNLEKHPDFLDAANEEGGPNLKKMHQLLIDMDYGHREGSHFVVTAFTPPPEHPAAGKHTKRHQNRTASQENTSRSPG